MPSGSSSHPGPSLCVETHCHPDSVVRSDRIGLVVSTIDPRKNAGFLLDWFHNTALLPPDSDLWWVGKLGWAMAQSDLERMAHPKDGRRVRFLENVSDATLCRLYQTAAWSIYPSLFEGFGFPILDALRHRTPVLASCTSSIREFDHPGVFFFDPNDPNTVDLAWQRLHESTELTDPPARLDQLYSWDLVARAILDAYAQNGASRIGGQPHSIASDSAEGEHPVFPISGPRGAAPGGLRPSAGMRVGIGPFTTQTSSCNRGLGRYIRTLVSALLSRDHNNAYVLYCQEGLTSGQLPKATNAESRLLRPDAANGEANLAEALTRLVRTNPDAVDVFVLLGARELGSGYALPAIPLNGLKVAALIHDLLPLFCHRDSSTGRPEKARPQADVESLNRLASYDALLVTSEANRESLAFLLKGSADRVVTIGTAADNRFFVPDASGAKPVEALALFQKLGIAGPFVLSVGSMEYQSCDHSQRLIEAFAMLPAKLRETHQLLLTYDLSPEARMRAGQCASEHGVADRLVLTDRLSDKALRLLYQRCAAFVSLTSYEELGLPLLEAMHCGAPVVIGKSAAQLELAADAALIFNPTDARALSDHLLHVLNEPELATAIRASARAGASLLPGRDGRPGAGHAGAVKYRAVAICN